MTPGTVKIGKLKIGNPLILAPMSGINCAAFRMLCSDFGAGLVFPGMLEEDRDLKSRKVDFFPAVEKKPLAAQIVGGTKEKLGPMVEKLQALGIELIDFNAGCPRDRYTKITWGGWYTKNPDKLAEIVGFLREKITCAFTVKTRIGYKRPHDTSMEALRICGDAGVDALTLHARYVSDGYTGKADWEAIKRLREKASIPIIGNGDVSAPADARRMMQFTGCDAVMIGRAATGNPFIFRQALACLSGKDPGPMPTMEERLEVLNKFLEYYAKYGRGKFLELKLHATWFMNRTAGTKKMRIAIKETKTEQELMELIKGMK